MFESISSKPKYQSTVLKMDRCILQRLVAAHEAGRFVDLSFGLSTELMPGPIILFKLNKEHRTGNKSIDTNNIDILGSGYSLMITF